MKVKLKLAVVLQDGNLGTIEVDAELDAPILATTNMEAKVLQVDEMWLNCMEGEE